jgi:AcrR family transcriptional regulator
MTTTRRGRPRNERLVQQRREEILDAAAQLFAEDGYSDADVQALADRLQVGKGTIYRYFPSKQELFLAAVDRGMERLHSTIEAEVAEVADPLERIVEAIYSFLRYFADHPELVELFVQERAQFKDRSQPTYFAFHEAKVGPWRSLFRGLVKAGRVRDLQQADNDVVSDLLYGTILANHVTGRRVSPEEQARNIVDIVFNGILTDAERRRRQGSKS